MQEPLRKIDAARRQLATAIELFFAGRDAVSVYSLAANSWEIIDTLCTRDKIESFSVQARENVPEGKDLKFHYINSPYRNFFKHADRDSKQVLAPLPDSLVEGVLFLAVEDYIRLNRRSPVQFQVFQLWYLAKHPNKLDAAVANEVLDGVAGAFPELPSLSRDSQLALGVQMLAEAAGDHDLANDPRTERAFD